MLVLKISRRLHKSAYLHLKFLSIGATSSGAYKNLVIEKMQNVTTIGINRPEKRNCVNPETASELISAFSEFESDPDSKVGVLYGKGGTFCSGFDLEFLSKQDPNDAQTSLEELTKLFFSTDKNSGNGPMGPSRRIFSKPVIAAVSGYAVAGGLELALMCDLRVIEDTAILGVYCRRFGVPLIDGGTVRLPHLIGLSRALEMILTGRSVNGKEAYDIGLSNKLTATGTGLGAAVQMGINIGRFPQECMNRDRLSAYNAMYNAKSLEEAMEYELRNGISVIQKESIKGAKSFIEGLGKHGSFHVKEPKNFDLGSKELETKRT